MTLTPHPELPGYYHSHGWEFSINPDEDGDLAYVEESIAAWTEWREFLLRQQASEGHEPLF